MVDRLVTTEDDPARRRRVVFAWVCIGAFLLTLLAFRAVLRPFVLGALLAYVLHPVAKAACDVRVAGRAAPRWVAVVVLYVGLIATLATTLTAVTPRVITEVRDFAVHEVPDLRRRAETTWLPRVRAWSGRLQSILDAGRVANGAPREADTPDDAVRVVPAQGGGWRVELPPEGVVLEQTDERHYRVLPARAAQAEQDSGDWGRRLRALGAGHVADIVRVGSGIVGGLIGGIFGFFMTMMVSAYMLVTEDQIFAFLRALVAPARRPAFDELLARLDRGLKGVVRGQLIICLVNGVLSAVGFALADLKYWPTLALLACVFSLVPIFGSILSSIPAVAIGLTQSFGTGVFVLLWILGIHQLEANLLNPKIMGDAAKIHPVLVVFSLLAGEHFFGILGALLAVPAMSIAQSVFLHWRRYALDWAEE